MAQFETWLKTDLKKAVDVLQLHGVMFSQDLRSLLGIQKDRYSNTVSVLLTKKEA